MMKFRKHKDNLVSKDTSKPPSEEKKTINSLKQEMISTLLKKRDATIESTTNETDSDVKEFNNLGNEFGNFTKKEDQTSQLLKQIAKTPKKCAIPKIDFTSGRISYPILAGIGENEDNYELLEKLCDSSSDLLEKIPYERFVVCPKHPSTLAINVRLYCSKCNSMDIEKLHLLEHNKCGYIAERKKYIVSDQKTTICPSCNKKIEDETKELHVPAMWYVCNGCNEKFDDVSIKLYCRDFDHDFSPNQSQTLEVVAFKLKNEEEDDVIDASAVFEKLTNILTTWGFTVEEKISIKGKSGRYHPVDLYAKDRAKNSVCIFIKSSNKEIDNSEINSKIIQVLDTEPSVAILVGFASISEKAKSIAASYNVSVISSQDTNEIIQSADKLLSKELEKFRENAPKP